MRVSADDEKFLELSHYLVFFFNNEKAWSVLSADDNTGEIVQLIANEKLFWLKEHEKLPTSDLIKHKYSIIRRYGDVRIEIHPNTPQEAKDLFFRLKT